MSAKLDALRAKVERGERVKEIRDLRGLSGDAFGELLEANLADQGMRTRYGKSKVSKMESGERKITVEEAAIITTLDPMKRGPLWFVFGPPAPKAVTEDEGGDDEQPPVRRPKFGGPRRGR